MDRFITRTKRTDLRTDLPKELPVLGKSSARPWKGVLSPKTPGNKRKEPEGPAMFVTAVKAYVAEHRDEYKKKNPEKEGKDVTKELTAQYDALSEEVKKPYEEAAEKDKQRYIEEMKAAGLETQEEKKAKLAAEKEAKKAAQAEEKAAEKEAKKAAKEADKVRRAEEKAEKAAAKGPKKPVTAYFAFSNAKREEVKAKLEAERTDPEKKVQVGDVAKALGALWKTLSDEDKAPYNEAVKEDKVRYEAELKEHKAQMEKKNAEKLEQEAAAKAQAAEAARQAELKAAADLGGGDSKWFEDYVDAAHKIESMTNVAPGDDGIKTFFFELLSYDVPTLEQAVPGMETQLDGENAEAFKHVILVCKDLITRRGGAPAAAPEIAEAKDQEDVGAEKMQVESTEEESAMEVEKVETKPSTPSWMEAAITEAVGQFPDMDAAAIRGNFEEVSQQSEHHVLAAFLKMEQAAEEAGEMKDYMLKLVGFSKQCYFKKEAVAAKIEAWVELSKAIDNDKLEPLLNGEKINDVLQNFLGMEAEMLEGGLEGMKAMVADPEQAAEQPGLAFAVKVCEEIVDMRKVALAKAEAEEQ